ncbi:ATP-binding protein [Butyrivibrio sp. FCS014]|uniref:ATP-binding protein n=1 Tax=Butyrivibrio sp. FCS014 TaxID=1408304 RepID=UPI000465B7E3|nr:ATP-binding protein [Butyrivibrio sp. FCS014]
MYDFLREHQLNIMMSLASICGIITLFVFISKSIPKERKRALLLIEINAMFLLGADRAAYIYRGDMSTLGYWMVRISNFIVFFTTLAIVYSFNMYLRDHLKNTLKLDPLPRRLMVGDILIAFGLLNLVVSQFTGWYYYFDAANLYHRGPGFYISMFIPLLILIIQLTLILQYRKLMRQFVLYPLLIFTVLPLVASIAQIFAYGLSLTNMTIVGTAVVVYIFDLIDLNRMSEEKEKAERANDAKSRFLANISHELRTPINTIMGMDEMILREDPTDVPKPYFLSVVGYAIDIKTASESLLSLINDLLDMSKIESGKMHLVEEQYSLEDMLRSIVTMIRVRSGEKDLTFTVDVDEDLPKGLFGDDKKIKQVILNLLTNAVKYTESGGFLFKISAESFSGEYCDIRISVKDSGIGIKPEDMDRLFSRYERLDEEKNISVQGTGLGLDISRHFVEMMGGKIWCESVYGEGSEFIVTLRQKITDDTPIGQFKERLEAENKGPYVPQFVAPDAEVLVVDDNPMNLSVIRSLLKATRVFVTTASSGEECLEKIKYGKFNVVLLDHMMPGMDGIETVERIREIHPDLPVYALTANATSGEEFYISKGFNGYLSKPIDSLTLEKTIMKHIPEEIMMQPTSEYTEKDLEAIPDNLMWIEDIPEISTEEGIKNSGGIKAFIYSLDLFYDTIDNNAEAIKNAYDSENIRIYTVKVHALKSSARIIGDKELASMCEELEAAGNREDKAFIISHHDAMMDRYLSYKEKLSLIKESTKDENEDNKEPISEQDLAGAYEALKELIPQMDYDGIEMVVNQLKDYKLPDKDAQVMAGLEKAMKMFDWDEMEKLIEG